MMKRNNEGIGGEGNNTNDDSNQKRRRVQFEAVKLPAVANVNEMRNRTLVYQAAKLRQDTLYKNKRITELEKENERAKRRQQTDESNFVKVYNLFSHIEKFVCAQVKNEFGEFYTTDPAPTGTEVMGMPSESYNKFVEQAKLNLKNAFAAFGKARQDRQQETTSFLNQMRSLLDEPSLNIDEIHKELGRKVTTYSQQIEKLQVDKARVDEKIYNLDRKRKDVLDKNSVLESKIQELEQQLQEQREETDRQLRLACKFEDRLIHIASEFQSGQGVAPSSSGATNQTDKKLSAPSTPPSESAAREMENLRAERDDQAALATRRLAELEETNKRTQMIAQENSRLKMELQTQPGITSDSIMNSHEYRTLKSYYSVAMKEYERVSKELEEITNERDKFRSAKETRSSMIAEENQKTMKEFQLQTDIHNAFYRVTHDSEMLRCEFESVKEEYNKGVKQSEWDEMKAILNTLRSMNKTMKSENIRLREKDKSAQKELISVRAELLKMKELQLKSIWVPINRMDSDSPEDAVERENQTLREQVRDLAAGDVIRRNESVQAEVNRQIGEQLAELETLRKTNETLTNDEQSLSDELESVCNSLEEEQERNAQLFIEKREQEDRNLKMMNERMVQSQVQNRLNEKVLSLENKAQTDAQIAKMHDFEKKTSEELVSKMTETLQFKSSEMTRITNLLETHRKQLHELGLAKEEHRHRADKYEDQVKSIQDICTTKSREVEDINFKKKRAEEELETVRVKYERAKRSDSNSNQTGDQILEEANRQMKETLTCPSCKVRPKDCIMLKCYHLFCETCVKTMYDTRQRKCPKCNSNFGANDYHRIFI